MTDVAFSWHGLPQFAARLFRGALDQLEPLGISSVVIGTPPEVPVKGMEEALGQKIFWIDAKEPVQWHKLDLDIPQVFIQSGWAYPALLSLGTEVKQAGGRVIGLCDSNWRGDFRQILLGPLAFRARLLRHFDAMIVAGREGYRLMRWYGMPENQIHIGMLGADKYLFRPGPPLSGRSKQFLFVGRFEPVKGILQLIEAFRQFDAERLGWKLHLCGGGALRPLIQQHPQIIVEDFVQPEDLVKRFHQARVFVLPSLIEPWGVVVHEAALCGCALLLSDRVGSASDLATPDNSRRFRAGSTRDLLRALHEAAECDGAWLANAERISLHRATQFGPKRFGEEVASIIKSFLEARAIVLHSPSEAPRFQLVKGQFR